jgi:AAA+ superfamily predicted ATPase
MSRTPTLNTRDSVLAASQKRVWFARDAIMESMQALGMPVAVDGDMIVVRGVERIARWLVVSSDESISSLFGASGKFSEALDTFKAMSPQLNVRHIAPAGITIRAGSVHIDGCALSITTAASKKPMFVIPVNRKKLLDGSEWVETVALVHSSLISLWAEIFEAADAADRVIEAKGAILRIYNGPDVKIQPMELDDIIMDADVRDSFVKDLTSFLSRKDFYDKRGLPWTRKYVLNGPPGVGKTSLMRWACTQLGMPSIGIDFSDQYAGGSTFTGALSMATDKSPCIFSLDDIDKVLSGDNKTRITPHVIQTALSGMGSMNGVVVIATCNDPQLLLRGPMARRFDVVIDVPLPTEDLRAEYLNKMLSVDAVVSDFISEIASETDGWSFSDLMSAVTAAANNVTSRQGDLIENVDLQYGVNVVYSRKRSSSASSMAAPAGSKEED